MPRCHLRGCHGGIQEAQEIPHAFKVNAQAGGKEHVNVPLESVRFVISSTMGTLFLIANLANNSASITNWTVN